MKLNSKVPEFKPVALEICFETKEELEIFRTIMNQSVDEVVERGELDRKDFDNHRERIKIGDITQSLYNWAAEKLNNI